MKRIVLLLVIGLVGLGASAREANAQRSGTMQVTARVVDTRESWNGLNSVSRLASSLTVPQQSHATVETSLSQISLNVEPARPEGSTLDRPRRAQVTIQYLKN